MPLDVGAHDLTVLSLLTLISLTTALISSIDRKGTRNCEANKRLQFLRTHVLTAVKRQHFR